MRLIVLDTNVVVSAGIRSDGPPAKIVLDWVLEGRVQVVVSAAVVTEYRKVVQRAKFRRYGFPPLWLEFLIGEAMWLEEPAPPPVALPDSADMPFLALAQATGAWLVTGNGRHFPQSAWGGATVLSPLDYLSRLLGKD